MRHALSIVVLACLSISAGPAAAQLRLPAIIGDNMVLQREANAPIWGWAAPGQKVTVTLAGKTAWATADAKGRWRVHFDNLQVGGAHEVVIEANETRTLHNVRVGEVWVCSGQSNMRAQMGWLGGKKAVEEANEPLIHLFVARMWLSPEPLDDTQGQWVVCTPKTVGAISAVGYFMGRDIQHALNVPVGLIDTSSGGTTAQTWMSAEAFKGHERFGGPADPNSPGVKRFYESLARYQAAMGQWAKDSNEAKANKQRPPTQPASPLIGNGYPPCGTYNAQVAPLLPYAIRGVAWYQGEANTGRPNDYDQLLALLIADWRRAFNNPKMAFLIVQLASFIPDNVPAGNWALLRDAQLRASKAENVGLAVTIDVGEPNNIHPRNKKAVGERLALSALHIAYGRQLVYSGPIYKSMKVEGDKIRLAFDHVGGGLAASDANELTGFMIAGEDKKLVPAEAKIEGSEIVVWSKDVPAPQAVRYAFADYPTCNLINKEGLPASPFRTDK